mgnify:CR=1 FL=1
MLHLSVLIALLSYCERWLAFYLLLVLIILYTVFPFYWAIVSSLRSGAELFSTELFPRHPAWANYVAVFREQPFARNILNSLFVAISTVILSLGLAVLVTAGVLSGVLGLAGADHAAQLAQRQQATPQAIAQVLVAPQA